MECPKCFGKNKDCFRCDGKGYLPCQKFGCKNTEDVDERYSFGVYAGIMCRECAIKGYRDSCGLLDGQQGNPQDLDEPLDED